MFDHLVDLLYSVATHTVGAIFKVVKIGLRHLGLKFKTSFQTRPRHMPSEKPSSFSRDEWVFDHGAHKAMAHNADISDSDIARDHCDKGEFDKALELYQEVLSIQEMQLGVEHPDTAATYKNIADIYYLKGDHSKSWEWWEKARDSKKNIIHGTPEKEDAPVIDEVQFSAATPNIMEKGKISLINIAMYEIPYKNHVFEELIFNYFNLSSITTTGLHYVKKNTKIRIILESNDVRITDEAEESVWNGKYSVFQYPIVIPRGLKKTQALFCGKVYFNGALVTKLKFVASVSGQRGQVMEIEKAIPKSAFVSYANQDRSKVASRIQGMLKMVPDLDIFFDVNSLRSGQNWEEVLLHEIKERDVFYLFWSNHAKTSEYVTKEWKYALKVKGIDAIEPVPLESPETCPPPKELRKKHFNDWMLRYI